MTSKRYIYVYACAKCSGPVDKTPCGISKSGKGKGPSATHGLHGWSCGTCGRGVKVSRTIR